MIAADNICSERSGRPATTIAAVRRPRPRCGSSCGATSRRALGWRLVGALICETARRIGARLPAGAAPHRRLSGLVGARVPPRLSGICAPTSLASRGPGWILVPGLVCTRFGWLVPWADRRSSVNWPGSSWVPPDPTRRSPWVAAPCLPHSSAILELMKRAKSVISRPSFHRLTAFSGERDRPALIAAVAQLAARPGHASPSF